MCFANCLTATVWYFKPLTWERVYLFIYSKLHLHLGIKNSKLTKTKIIIADFLTYHLLMNPYNWFSLSTTPLLAALFYLSSLWDQQQGHWVVWKFFLHKCQWFVDAFFFFFSSICLRGHDLHFLLIFLFYVTFWNSAFNNRCILMKTQ